MEWKEEEESCWDEFDWQRQLRRDDLKVREFLRLYLAFQGTNRLGTVLGRLGWKAIEADSCREPFTLHSHPLLLGSTALAHHIFSLYEGFLMEKREELSLADFSLFSTFARDLHFAQWYSVFALEAFNVQDLQLAAAHFKRSFSRAHRLLGALEDLAQVAPSLDFVLKGRPALFDLREIWLMAMRECRHAAHRKRDD